MKNGQPRILQHNLFVPETHATSNGSVSLFCAPNKRFCTTTSPGRRACFWHCGHRGRAHMPCINVYPHPAALLCFAHRDNARPCASGGSGIEQFSFQCAPLLGVLERHRTTGFINGAAAGAVRTCARLRLFVLAWSAVCVCPRPSHISVRRLFTGVELA
jgi:hypothetical protein